MAINIITALTTAMNKVVSLASSKVDKTVIRKVYTSRTLTTTVTNGTNWGSCTASVNLCGNQLRIRFYGDRNSNSGEGNISNEIVCTLTVDTAGYISGIYNATGITSETGDLASFYITSSMSDDIATIKVYMSATAGPINTVNGYIDTCAVLNASAFL